MNKFIGIGNLVKEVDFRAVQYGNMASGTLAINSFARDASGERISKVDYVPFVAYGKTAEVLRDYTQKGSKIMIEGSFVTSSYTAKDGSTRYVSQIRVAGIELLSPKQSQTEVKVEVKPSEIKKSGAKTAKPANVEEEYVVVPEDTTIPF